MTPAHRHLLHRPQDAAEEVQAQLLKLGAQRRILSQAIGMGIVGRGRLVDDARHTQARSRTGVLRQQAVRVVKQAGTVTTILRIG